MRVFLQISLTNMNEKIANKHLFFHRINTVDWITFELPRSRTGSEVTPWINALHDILPNLVN